MSSYLDPIRRLLSNGAEIEKYLRKIKESYKGPFSYLGIISLIFLVSLPFISFSKPLPAKETSSFLSCLPETLSQPCSQDLFLNPANRLLIESPDFLLVEKSSLRAATPPALVSPQVLGTLIGEYGPEEAKKVIKEYIVESGDTLSSLAAEFEVSLNTILWANDLTEKSTLKIGQKLVIPPVSGVIHYVKSGDTVSEIARTYKGKIDKIVAFNDLSDENDIYIGDILFVPDGVMPPVSARPTITQTPVSSAYFIPPTKGVISQGLHWYNAVDFANSCGALVFAAAQGVVQRISYGWNDGYGSYLTILHPNGTVTLYAHLSEILVSSGSNVSQGSIIGRVGNTGNTKGPTGCHVHFEVRGGQNPFAQ
jgi:LysM repeat protein